MLKTLRAEQSTALLALFLLLACNLPFWRHLWQILHPAHLGDFIFLGFAALGLFLILNLVLILLALPYVFRPLASFLLIGSAGVTYFMNQYGVVIDAGMIQSAMETNPAETMDLLSWKMLAYLLILAVLPLWYLWRTPIIYRPFPREAMIRGAIVLGSLLASVAIVLCFYKDFSSLLRNHRELRFLLTPSNYLQATSKYLRKGGAQEAVAAIGEDARHNARWAQRPRKSLTVIVVGETARAANFSLNGYDRETNPLLKKEAGLINFPDFHSCGTDTAVSVPCMFSMFGRRDYSDAKAKSHEGLLDILKRVGLTVQWRDNQSGCKGACDRIEHDTITEKSPDARCANGECLDESLLGGLQARIDRQANHEVLVLHMMGSHGPAYYKRYPREFAVFQPECQTNQLDQCSPEQLRNSYDNSLRYTDYVLSRLIDLLRANDSQLDTAMFYMSDHGESLGEHNLYLHGTPYLIAPDYQTHVPALMWLSPGYQQHARIDAHCVRGVASQRFSHDNLFHSVLGMLDIHTALYQSGQDIFAACRR